MRVESQTKPQEHRLTKGTKTELLCLRSPVQKVPNPYRGRPFFLRTRRRTPLLPPFGSRRSKKTPQGAQKPPSRILSAFVRTGFISTIPAAAPRFAILRPRQPARFTTLAPRRRSDRRGSAGFSLIPGCNAGRCYYGHRRNSAVDPSVPR
jgi:hypothetical protein